MKSGIQIIIEEMRQFDVEGWTPEHIDKHTDESLAQAAACYALPKRDRDMIALGKYIIPRLWPRTLGLKSWKPTPDDRIKELAMAGAMIAEEIDRIQRTL